MARTSKIKNRENLYREILAKKSYLCVGLDPDPDRIPDCFGSGISAIEEFCISIIKCTQHVAVAYKPNLAFFELFGAVGWNALQRIISCVPDNCLLIADAKRGDIGNTSKKYATAIFDGLGADAVTVAPYMGEDSVRPFTERIDRWTILLALTSNPGADDFEFHGDPPLYELVIDKAKAWGTPDNLMFVVGATRPEILRRIRKLIPEHFILVPGVGAQGGSIAEVAGAGLNAKCGLLINSSRSILYAVSSPRSKSEALDGARKEAENLASQMADTFHL